MERAKQWRRKGRDAETYADGECYSMCKFSYRGSRGYGTPSVGGDRFVTAQDTGTVGELLSAGRGRWRTLPSWLTRSTHRLGGVRAYSLPVATSNGARLLAHEGLQQQPSTGKRGVSAPVAATMRPTANLPPVGRERNTTAPAGMNRERGRQTRALGGLQQQEWTVDQQEGFSYNRQLRCTQR